MKSWIFFQKSATIASFRTSEIPSEARPRRPKSANWTFLARWSTLGGYRTLAGRDLNWQAAPCPTHTPAEDPIDRRAAERVTLRRKWGRRAVATAASRRHAEPVAAARRSCLHHGGPDRLGSPPRPHQRGARPGGARQLALPPRSRTLR